MTYSRIHSLIERLLILPALVLCIGSPAAFAATIGGGTYYVSGSGDDAAGDGSESNPWRTITHAVSQAAGGAPTIMVGAGTYDVDAGEDFPIRIDEDDAMGITISGSGSGSATIVQGFFEDTLLGVPDLFEADEYVSGTILISGLNIQGTSDCMLDLDSGAGEVLIQNVNANGIGLLDVDGNPYGGSYVLSNNHVMGVSGNALSMTFEYDDSYNTAEGSFTTNLSLNNNTFSDCGVGLYYSVSQSGGGDLDFNLSVIDNEFIDCSTAIYMSESIMEGAHYDAVEVIQGNSFQNVDVGIHGYFHCSYTCLITRDIQITDNEMLMTSSQSAIKMSTGVDEYMEYQEDVLIAGNEISGAYYGVWAEFLNDYESSNMERNWQVLNNDIRNCSSEALYFENSFTHYDTRTHDYELLVDGNTLQGNGAGLYVSHSVTYGSAADSSFKHVITRNQIIDNSDYAVYITASVEDAEVDHDVVLRGNVFQGNQVNSRSAVVEVNINTDDAAYDVSFDMGSVGAYGYNTIIADEANPLSGSISCDVYTSSVIAGQVNMVGNWWGTQDLMEIAGRVWDQADSSMLFTADLSNPLPDSLDFTAEYHDDLGLIVTAGADAGFVAYAGTLTMMGSVTGPGGFSDGGEVEASWVSEDYQTLIVPPVVGVPAGDYEICLTNPGGQTGCASFTVGDDEDCSQNQAPVAVSDNVETDQGVAIVIDLTVNDSDYTDNMDPTAVTITQGPDKGTVVNNGDGTATYTPDPDEDYTTDTFNYTVSDTCGAISNIASCQIFIGHGDGGGSGGGDEQHDPGAVYDSAVTEMGAAVTIDILSNDYDVDGDALDAGSVVITQDPAKGTVVDNSDGTVTYTPNEGIVSTTDTFNYTVDDEFGGTSNIATVSVSIQYVTDTTDITGGVGGNAGGRKTQGARGGLGNGGTPTYGGTRNP
jgi:hypothetical protein